MKRVIHPDDRENIINKLERNVLLKALRQKGTVSLTYQQLVDNEYHYVNLLAFIQKADKEHIVVGVRNIDAEKSREAQSQTFSDIALALAKRYEVIYLVNIVTNEYTEYSASENYRKLKVGTTGKDFFAESQMNMKRDIYEPDLPMMSTVMQKENLMKGISTYGKVPVNYRLMLDGRPQYVSLYAVRPQDDSDHIIIAVANIDEAMQKEFAYQDMANKDSLTGVKNKRAYAQAEAELDDYIAKFTQPPFSVVVCDINGLKEVNDTKGHNAGDAFIRNACSIICNIFKHSPVFRIGGDEFAVIMKGSDYDERTHLMEELNKVLEANKHNGMVILAAGISDFDPDMDMRVQDVFERADNLMYDNKKICKALGDNK